MSTPLTNYIVFYKDTPSVSLLLAAHSPLNAAKDFVLQNRAGVSDAEIVVRSEANPSDTKRFQNIGGSWSEISAPAPKTGTNSVAHIPASLPARGSRMVKIKSVSIFYAAIYGGLCFCFGYLVKVVLSAVFLSATFGAPLSATITASVQMLQGAFWSITLVVTLFGAASGAIAALLYNVIAAVMGGLRVELADDN
jgi:hypothetical protein